MVTITFMSVYDWAYQMTQEDFAKKYVATDGRFEEIQLGSWFRLKVPIVGYNDQTGVLYAICTDMPPTTLATNFMGEGNEDIRQDS